MEYRILMFVERGRLKDFISLRLRCGRDDQAREGWLADWIFESLRAEARVRTPVPRRLRTARRAVRTESSSLVSKKLEAVDRG